MVNKKIDHIYTNSDNVIKEIAPCIIKEGSSFLKSSRCNEKYGISNREIFGLCVVKELRQLLEPGKDWFLSTNKSISDDGIVGYLDIAQGKVDYYEHIEQVYLPGAYLKRTEKTANDYFINNILKIKNKGDAYETDKTLFVFNDSNSGDPFYWTEIVKPFFVMTKFLHLYFLGLKQRTDQNINYYLLSLSNQKHRQNLNGEFEFVLTMNKIDKLTRTQDLTELLIKRN